MQVRPGESGRDRMNPPALGAMLSPMLHLKVIVEKHDDGYVAYPLGLKGTVVAQGDSYEEALANVKSAIQFHIETFGPDMVSDDPVTEAFVAETAVAV
jgi:predicted RNase H-like HicB family nuclease